jgi:hypothetical protein
MTSNSVSRFWSPRWRSSPGAAAPSEVRGVVGVRALKASRHFPVNAPMRVAAAQPLTAEGSDSGGSWPPRSVPAINSSGALSSGMKPDFIPK